MSIMGATPLPGYAALTCSTYPKVDYTAGCKSPCHESCTTCSGSNAAANECTGCKVSGATVAPSSPGTCVCGSGFVPKTNPSTSCVACTNGCAYCLSGTDTYCWDSNSLSRLQFAMAARDYHSLPYTAQTHSLLCYRMNIADVPDCAISSIAGMIGAIGSQGSYAATADQCYEMLKIEWPYVQRKFTIDLFPNFVTPLTASEEDVIKVKTILQLWILQFGAAVMKTDPDWISLVQVFNRNPIPWATMLAWTDTSPPQYTTDGSTAVNFPSGLSTWLSIVGTDKAAFNTFSQVCEAPSCGNVHCTNALPNSLCGNILAS